MSDGLAADTSALIDLVREDRPDPPHISTASRLFIPLPALGELYAGAFETQRETANLAAIARTLELGTVLNPDVDTARKYGQLRGVLRIANLRGSKINDLWIAALCLQHDLPLLTNDRGFDHIPNLRVLHW